MAARCALADDKLGAISTTCCAETPTGPGSSAPWCWSAECSYCLHAVSDIGITGLVGAKLMTYALESVGDVFGSLSTVAAGLLVIRSDVLPRWLGWVSILAGIMLFLQGFGVGGVIASFGLILDLVGLVLFLIYISGVGCRPLPERSGEAAQDRLARRDGSEPATRERSRTGSTTSTRFHETRFHE